MNPESQYKVARLIRIQESMRLSRSTEDVDRPLDHETDPWMREAERGLARGQLHTLSPMALFMAVVSGRALLLQMSGHPPRMLQAIRETLEPLETYFQEADFDFLGPALIA